jgi:hypothetical protein
MRNGSRREEGSSHGRRAREREGAGEREKYQMYLLVQVISVSYAFDIIFSF